MYSRGEVNSTMDMYIQELQKVTNELQLHICILHLICNVKDDCEVEIIQFVLEHYTDRLMKLDDEVLKVLEF